MGPLRATFVPAVRAVAGRPRLWPTALRQYRRMVPHGWWARSPHLPVPPPAYLRFRLLTNYGGDGTGSGVAPEQVGRDVVAYLEWCRAWPAHR